MFLSQLNVALAAKDCYVYYSDQQLYLAKHQRFVYPDVMVVCGEQEFRDEKQLQIQNPKLIIEVLSGSTEGYDKTDKFSYYRSLPSFKEYVLINAEKVYVDAYYREASDLWRISSAYRLEDTIHLYSLGIDLSVKSIYAKTKDVKEEA